MNVLRDEIEELVNESVRVQHARYTEAEIRGLVDFYERQVIMTLLELVRQYKPERLP